MREYTNKLLDLLEDGVLSYEQVLDELLHFLSEDDIKDFCLNSFGGEGIFTDEDEEF